MRALAPPAPFFLNRVPRAGLAPVALKVQRRKYATNAIDELELRARIGSADAASRFVLECAEVFVHERHICQVYELHGNDTHALVKRGPLPLEEVRLMTRQVLRGLRLMHASGLIHSDVKPGNVLWCGRKREARLIDFGNAAPELKTGSAIGTREYCPPEMLLGNPMGAPVDLWALGCSVFEWLTGQALFDPWELCHAKYDEFGSDDGESTAPDEDDLEEEREQLPPGTVLAGKYRLLEEIGRGKCATVWKAQPLHEELLRQPMPTREEARSVAAEYRKPKPAAQGYNIYEVVQGYEHFVLMQELLGAFPAELAKGARFRHLFYDPEGALRFHPEIKRTSLGEILAGKYSLAEGAAKEAEAFLLGLLQFEPERRMTADEALRSEWLKGV
jgi:serine/threonine protein kinase